MLELSVESLAEAHLRCMGGAALAALPWGSSCPRAAPITSLS